MIKYISIIFFFASVPIFSQDSLVAEKDLLSIIQVGSGQEKIDYIASDEGFFSPTGPIVLSDSTLLFYPTTDHNHFIKFESGKFYKIPLFKGWPTFTSTGYVFSSQQGMVNLIGAIPIYRFNKNTVDYLDWGNVKTPSSGDASVLFLPFGSIIESTLEKSLFSLEYKNFSSFVTRNHEESRTWLQSQPGGFSIGSDGRLYRNGYLWSVSRDYGEYVGRLMSGHAIHVAGGISGFPREFGFVNSKYELEMMITIPWAYDERENKKGFHWFNYGVGPWGEIYFLIAPPQVKTNQFEGDGAGGRRMILKFDETKPAELVVVRNHLKYFGRLNDGSVRLRKDPSTSGEILGTYPNKTGFRILEKGTKEETIGGKKNVWYKVRLLDGKEGWFFGSFVHNLYDGPNGNPPPWPNVPDW